VRVDRKGEVVALDEQVVVGRREEDDPALQGQLVVGVDHVQRGHRAEQAAERGRVRVRAAVLRDDHARVEVGRQAAEDDPERVEPAPGGSDRDEVAAALHLTLRYRRSSASSSS
jgi:hypothetical protein